MAASASPRATPTLWTWFVTSRCVSSLIELNRVVLLAAVVAPPPLVHQGSLLTLQGAGAYDAAVHCASVSAARRILSQRGDTPTHAAAAAGGPPVNPFNQHLPYTPRGMVRTSVTSPLESIFISVVTYTFNCS